MSKSFIDRFNAESDKGTFWSLNKRICAVLFAMFLAVIMFNTTGCSQSKEEDIVSVAENPIEPQEQVKVGNDGVNAAIAPDNTDDDIKIVSDQSTISNGATVSMSIGDSGREDPFLPDNERMLISQQSTINYDLLPPPESITVDESAVNAISTKVSGIMYDKVNPSAILNISGSDYLVRSGDVINGYKVLSINQTTVTVQHGVNIYKAGVGEMFTGDGINYNTISNLDSKFGGSKNIVNIKNNQE